MTNRSPLTLFCTLSLCTPGFAIRAQEGDPMPTERVRTIPPGGFVDLDTGIILATRERKPLQADLLFDRDGLGFFLQAMSGAMAAKAGDTTPEGEWSSERLRLGRRDSATRTWFLRTDRGVARVTLAVADPYTTASAVLRWVVVPPGAAVFLPAPTGLEANWKDKNLEVSWHGDEPRWLVEVETGTEVRKVTTDRPTARIEGLAPDGTHRLRVRGLGAAGAISLPADVVQFGARQVPVRGSVVYPDRWYDQSGGLSVRRGEIATEDADVVCYLYGVYVPGGGVQKIGHGVGCWRALAELPESDYLPSYGRLDGHDVLAVRLADGRYAKLWLEPTKATDVRSGMTVHFTFLPDGRRHLLAPPAELSSELVDGTVELRWAEAAAAVSYRVLRPGAPLPQETKTTNLRLEGLLANRLHDVEVVALAKDGETSEPARLLVHTFGPEAVVGTFTLRAQDGGFLFATATDTAAGKPCDLALVGGAGGSSYLTFAARGGIAPAGGHELGVFPDEAALAYRDDFGSDDRQPDADRFFVRTADGGRAFVRITARGWPQTKLEFVWLPHRR